MVPTNESRIDFELAKDSYDSNLAVGCEFLRVSTNNTSLLHLSLLPYFERQQYVQLNGVLCNTLPC